MADTPSRAARRCRVKQARTIIVDGFDPPIKLRLITTFGETLALQEKIAQTEDGDTKAQIELMLGFLDTALQSWEGVFGEDEQPVPYSREAFTSLDVEDASAIIKAIQNIGEAGSGNPKAETALPEASGEQPTP